MTGGVEHPYVPAWEGQRAWTPPGEPPSPSVSFEAGELGAPFSITHHREMMFDADELTQDYNYIDYHFGSPDAPIRARHYLLENRISLALPVVHGDVEEGGRHVPADILAYLQRRFDMVELLTQGGYQQLWSAGR